MILFDQMFLKPFDIFDNSLPTPLPKNQINMKSFFFFNMKSFWPLSNFEVFPEGLWKVTEKWLFLEKERCLTY